ncbi:MAG: HEAT repeat domain-containing protein, partial [Chitinophagaceae bacterium]
SEERKQTKTLLAADFVGKKENELGELLKNADMRVRMKAQFELAKRGSDGDAVFQKTIVQKANQLARVNAIWGISQMARQHKKYAQSLLPLLQDSDPEIRAQAAKWLGDIKYQEAGDKLIPLLKDEFVRARFFAAEALGRIMYEPAINPIIDLLKNNNDEDAYIRHAGSLALARIGKADPIIALSKDPSRAVRIAAVVALRRMSNPGIASFLNDKDEFIVTEAARAINDDLSIKDALPALGNLLNTARFTNEALIRRSINASLEMGTDEAMQNLINYSIMQSNPAAMRAEAIDALSTWSKPSVLDRVDGRYRGLIQRDPTLVKTKAGDALVSLLNSKEIMVKISAVKASSKMGIKQGTASLLGLLKNDPQAEVRVEALKALASMQDEQIGGAIKQALADKDKSVRVAGIDLIGKMNIPKELMVSLLSDVINTKTIEEKQAALLTLGNLPVQNTNKVFDDLLKKMSSGKLSSDIYLELAEAIDSSRSAELISGYKKISSTLSPDTLASAYAGSLNGGNADRGRRIFYRNETAQCMRCHSYNDYGGNAGPRLNGVGGRLTRQRILESLINPSANIASGFGIVTLELKNGKTISGVLIEENNTSLTMKGDKQNDVIQKDQVVKRINASSSMPDMKNILSKKQIRDVVSFLSELKEDK